MLQHAAAVMGLSHSMWSTVASCVAHVLCPDSHRYRSCCYRSCLRGVFTLPGPGARTRRRRICPPIRADAPPQCAEMASVVWSMLFARHDRHLAPMTKAGNFIYHGDGLHFCQWEFGTSLRMTGAQSMEDTMNAINNSVDGLSGDAFTAAQEVGILSLTECAWAMTTTLSKPMWLLARQDGERMQQHTSRCRCCWELLRQRDT